MADLPGSVLFACTLNAVRSPMAQAILKYLHGHRIYVESCGVRRGEPDAFVDIVLDEIGIAIGNHRPKTFEDLEDGFFDLVISLSPEAQHHAVEFTRNSATELEFWHMPDPSLVEGSREQRLVAYRQLRDLLMRRILERFPPSGSPAP
ncbi:Glutaredoxin arsenate reductase [bacterium HR40]|nr:Glutaredoxin arsenate reductase [bacterium HR40]